MSRFHVWAGSSLLLLLLGCSANRDLELSYDTLWSVAYGSEADTVAGVFSDGNGELVLQGRSRVNGGSDHDFVARVDEAGKQRWREDLDFNSSDSWIGVQDIATQTGSTFVLGGAFGPVTILGESMGEASQSISFLLELDKSGKLESSQVFQGENGQVSAERIALDPAGRSYIAGTFSGDVDFGGGILSGTNQSTFLLALEADGSFRYAKRFGGSWGSVHDIVVDGPSGDLFMIGTFSGFINFGTGTLTNGPNGAAVYLVRLAESGEPRWAKHFLGNGDFYAHFDGSGDIVVSGLGDPYSHTSFGGTKAIDGVFTTQLDGKSGAHRWTRQFGGKYSGYGTANADIDIEGRIVVVAEAVIVVKEAQELDEPPWYVQAQYERRRSLLTLDSDGSTVASLTLSNKADDGYGYSAGSVSLAAAADTIVVATKTEDTLDFGDGPVDHNGLTKLTKLRLSSQ